jgi:hypothetical protein
MATLSDLGHVGDGLVTVVALGDVARRHRDDLLVLAGIVLHHQHAGPVDTGILLTGKKRPRDGRPAPGR